MEDDEEQSRVRGNRADLTVGILLLSAIQGRPYDEQVEILGATVLQLSRKLGEAIKAIDSTEHGRQPKDQS